MIKEGIALADKWQKFRQQNLSVFRLKRQDVPGANAFKLSVGDLALIGPAFTEERLPRYEFAGKRGAIRNRVPATDMQILGVDVFKPDDSFNAIGLGISLHKIGVLHHLAELHHLPTGFQGTHIFPPA
ncbi:hypothetical protein AD428_04490 [Achromobacter sp. DMS1]|nr:hypothetical protein AD428_04490 [Achromobacter sp. DMS1]